MSRKQVTKKALPATDADVREAIRARYSMPNNETLRAAYPDFAEFETLLLASMDRAKLATMTREQAIQATHWAIIFQVEFTLCLVPVVLCREGKHPACRYGQPFDPRCQTPEGFPLSSRKA